MGNKLELSFIGKVIENNNVFLQTKIGHDYFTDELAKILFCFIGNKITEIGEFKPLIHLKELCEDTNLINKLRNEFQYDVKFETAEELVHELEKYQKASKEIRYETLEAEIKKIYIKSRLSNIAYKILEDLEDIQVSEIDLLTWVSSQSDLLLYDSQNDVQVKTMSDITKDMLEYISSDEVDLYIPTGVDAIDSVSEGSPQNCVISWVAPAKCGKSALLIDSLVRNLLNGRTCAFFSIEMNLSQVMQRMYANYAGIPFEKIAKKTYSDIEKQILKEKTIEFQERCKGKLFYYFDRNGITTKTIETYIKNLKKTGVIIQDLFIDYLQILESSTKRHAPKVEKMAELPKEIRMLMQKTDTRIFCPIQSLSSSRSKNIEDWTCDDIYYAKEAEREFDYVSAMKDEDEVKKWKCLVSRFLVDDEIKYFPSVDLDTLSFYKSEPYIKLNKEQLEAGFEALGESWD